MKKTVRIVVWIAGIVVVLCIALMLVCNQIVVKNAEGKTFSEIDCVKFNKVGLLLGAPPRARFDGITNYFFIYRIDAAEQLYKAGKIEQILISGDENSLDGVDETECMRDSLVARGIPASAIILDGKGYRTICSIINANKVYGLKNFTVISQKFHNERAIYQAEHLGLDVENIQAYNAKDPKSRRAYLTTIREYFARVKMFWDLFTFDKNKSYVNKNAMVQNSDTKEVNAFFSSDGELSWNEIANMDIFEKRKFYFSLTDSVPDLWKIRDIDATSYAEEDSIPILPANKTIRLHYRQEVKGYQVKVEFMQKYGEFIFGQAILYFSKPGHTFKVYCDAFSDEQLIPNKTNDVKGKKSIDLSKLKEGSQISLNYIPPKANEYLSAHSPFYFKDMDFDGEEELVINNLCMGSRGSNEYDVFKVLHVEKPLRLKGLPFTDDLYKITNYNVEYEPKTKSVVDKRYDGFDAYGYYRYKSIHSDKNTNLKKVFMLEEAEDRGFYHPKNRQASDSVNLIQPYKKYKRVDGKFVVIEKGIYELGNYGWNNNEIVLESIIVSK